MSSVSADRDTKSLLPNGTFLQHQGHHNSPHQHHPQHSHHPRDCGAVGASGRMPTEPRSVHMDFARNEAWLHPSQHQHPREQKVFHARPVGPAGHVGNPVYGGHGGHAVHHHPTGYRMMQDAPHTLQMMQPQPQPQQQELPPCKEERVPPPLVEDHSVVRNEPLAKKRQQGRQPKSPKPKKPKALFGTAFF